MLELRLVTDACDQRQGLLRDDRVERVVRNEVLRNFLTMATLVAHELDLPHDPLVVEHACQLVPGLHRLVILRVLHQAKQPLFSANVLDEVSRDWSSALQQ